MGFRVLEMMNNMFQLLLEISFFWALMVGKSLSDTFCFLGTFVASAKALGHLMITWGLELSRDSWETWRKMVV